MRYNFVLALFATASEAAFSLGGHGHSHANAIDLDVVKDANYHMKLTYMVEPDQFGDNWLVFEPLLKAQTDEAKFKEGQFVSQWFQIEEGSHHMHGDDHGHDHRILDSDAEYETVQATVEWKPGKPVTRATGSLQQTCGSKLQETFVGVSYEQRIEANNEAIKCSPWFPDLGHWSTDDIDVLMAFKRKLDDPQVSQITLKSGTYEMRAGYFVETTGVTDQVMNHEASLEFTIADQAKAGLLVTAALLSTLSALF